LPRQCQPLPLSFTITLSGLFVATYDGGLDSQSMNIYINGMDMNATGDLVDITAGGSFDGMVNQDGNLTIGGRTAGQRLYSKG